jgi:hypothetical protein
LLVTTAVSGPAAGTLVKVTVSEFTVEAVTVPAPELNATLLFPAVGLNPKPSIVNVDGLGGMEFVFGVTTGKTVATWTGAPLLASFVVTVAVSEPETSPLRLVTVSCVLVAAVTVPVAPLLKATRLLAAVVEKPVPLIVIDDASAARLAVLEVTVGGIVIVVVAAGALSTCAVTLDTPPVEPAVKVEVAWRLAILESVGLTLPKEPPSNVIGKPFITVGLIVVPDEFLLKSAVSVEVPPSATEVGSAVKTRSMRGSLWTWAAAACLTVCPLGKSS